MSPHGVTNVNKTCNDERLLEAPDLMSADFAPPPITLQRRKEIVAAAVEMAHQFEKTAKDYRERTLLRRALLLLIEH